MALQERVFIVVGGLAALVLQVFVAPYIAVFSAVPNFVVAFAVLVAVLRAHAYSPLLPFVLGLAFDFLSAGPVGAMAFSLTLFCTLLAAYCARAGNESVFMQVAFMALGVLLVEVSYGVFLMLFGLPVGLLDALAYRIAPCFLYDFALCCILFPLGRRFLKPAVAVRTDITQLR